MHRELNTCAAIDSLVQVLIEKAGTDQNRIVGRNVAEVSIVEIEHYPRMNLETRREKALSDPQAHRLSTRVGCGVFNLHGLIQTNVPLIREVILGEHEGPLNGPTLEVDAAPDRTGIVEILKASAMNVEVTSAHLPIWIVVPRRGIGGGPEERADRGSGRGPES